VSQLASQKLRKRYKSRTVVQDVSLEVSSGEVVGLLGPNGAGKTTCFYMIVGLVPVDAGSIHLDGNELTHLPIHRRARLGLSYLPQEASVFRKLTVEENIRAVLELQLGDKDYLTGSTFTVADAYLFVLLGWTRPTQIDLARWPNLAAFHKRVAARPKVQEAMQAEGLLKKAA